MAERKAILVVQTAFLGDVILTLPLVQALKSHMPESSIDVLVVPNAAGALRNHPAVRNIIEYDKKGAASGIGGFLKQVKRVREGSYGLAVVPHRSIRSALLVRFAGIPRRIGFDRSAGSWFFTDLVHYDPLIHEVDRNAKLLVPIDLHLTERGLPDLYPGEEDQAVVRGAISVLSREEAENLITLAPGSPWNTKRWPGERYAGLAKKLRSSGFGVMIIGGKEDSILCEEIAVSAGMQKEYSVAGRLSLLQSAALVRRSRLLVSNDSAPMHIAVAMRTPVVAIFGATVPSFGFAPYGARDVIVETNGLSCRPCSIHGGEKCPIGTFDCMMNISVDTVYERVMGILGVGH